MSGQLMAQGIQQGLAKIGEGIKQHRKKQAEKAAIEDFAPIAIKNGWVDDIEEFKVSVKALGGMQNAVPFMAQMERQQQLQAQQQAAAQAAAAKQAQEEAAIRAALQRQLVPYGQGRGILRDPTTAPTPEQAVAAYMQAGGRDPQTAAMLGKLPAAPEPINNTLDFREDPISGSRFAVGPKGNFASSGTNPEKTKAEEQLIKQVKIGDRTLFIGPGNRYFDEGGQPVDFGGSDWTKALDSLSGQTNQPTTDSETVPAIDPTKLSARDQQALQWAQQNPQDPRADAILQRIANSGR